MVTLNVFQEKGAESVKFDRTIPNTVTWPEAAPALFYVVLSLVILYPSRDDTLQQGLSWIMGVFALGHILVKQNLTLWKDPAKNWKAHRLLRVRWAGPELVKGAIVALSQVVAILSVLNINNIMAGCVLFLSFAHYWGCENYLNRKCLEALERRGRKDMIEDAFSAHYAIYVGRSAPTSFSRNLMDILGLCEDDIVTIRNSENSREIVRHISIHPGETSDPLIFINELDLRELRLGHASGRLEIDV